MSKSTSNAYDVCVVGAGLTGLATVYRLQNAGLRVLVLEASSRIGGRIHAIRDTKTNAPLADLGPSWIWPPYQKHASDWVQELGLELHPQYEQGMALLDIEPNQSPRSESMPGQHGMSRITGGPSAFIDAISGKLPTGTIHRDAAVNSVEQVDDCIAIETSNSSIQKVIAKHVVIATPLRVAQEAIQFKGKLPDELEQVLSRAPTWMAAQAKAIILYNEPFWRDLGLSGRIASRLGPMVEAHDLSGKDGTPAALFGFIGLPAHIRSNNAEKLEAALIDQLVRCFGPQAENYSRLHIEDWAQNPFICTQADRDGSGAHPSQLPDVVRKPLWSNNLHFAVAETATGSPGLIDGAFESAERATNSILTEIA